MTTNTDRAALVERLKKEADSLEQCSQITYANGALVALRADLEQSAALLEQTSPAPAPGVGSPPETTEPMPSDQAIATAFRQVLGPEGGKIGNEIAMDYILQTAREIDDQNTAPGVGEVRAWECRVVGSSEEDGWFLPSPAAQQMRDNPNFEFRALVVAGARPSTVESAVERDAARWRHIARKLCVTGNGDGTWRMSAINLPSSIQGRPESGEVQEFCGKAIDDQNKERS